MHYKDDGQEIKIGDKVIIEKDVHGLVVCDFDKQQCLKGYEDWLTKEELVGGGTLSSGVMIKTEQLGFVHYAEEDESIEKL